MLKLPDLTHTLDAGDLDRAYSGIELEMVLYPKDSLWEPSWETDEERKAIQADEPWQRRDWWNRAQWIREIRIPEAMRTEDEPDVIVISGDPQALYELEHREDWIPMISLWACAQYLENRDVWSKEALGN